MKAVVSVGSVLGIPHHHTGYIKPLKMRMEEVNHSGVVLPGTDCPLECGSKDGRRAEKRMARENSGATSVVWRRLPASCV